MNKKLMFVVNVDWFFMSHRLPIAIEAQRQGYQVHLAVGVTSHLVSLREMGFVVHPLAIERSNTGLLNLTKTFWQLTCLFKRENPDLVHLITIKPVLLGGLAARLTGVKSVVAAVSGLGFVFTDVGMKAQLRRLLVGTFYRVALGHRNIKVIFQNPEDRKYLMKIGNITNNKTELIRGSGVKLSAYHQTPLPEQTPIIVMAARLLKDKGVFEFVEAARLLKFKNCDARFCLVGKVDSGNRSSISDGDLAEWVRDGVVENWGHCSDMDEVFNSAYLVVLPSYREGLPKVLIEAAACGRAVVTTDVPGCRDAIVPNVTGVLVPARDAENLAVAIKSLIDDRPRCEKMGLAGRALAVECFDIENVVAKHMQIFQQLQASAV